MLKLDQVTISYGKTEVVHHVSLEVNAGEIVTIIGANGAGKSTILNTITGLHKLTSGSILFHEKEIGSAHADQLVKEGIRLVPEGRQIFPSHTVLDNLLLGAYIEKDKQKIDQRLEEMFHRFPRLKEREKQFGGTLSGGEQQMLAIARALMTAPDLLILDEPSLGLAPIITAEVFSLLKDICQSGVTVLLVEQMANSALKISDRAYVLETGNIVFSGTAAEVMQNDVLVKAYLGSM
jgi:branched-chain amino acid transport system ATP-binding protein